MLEMMDNPMFLSQMNEAMNNPAVVDMMLQSPMVRKVVVVTRAFVALQMLCRQPLTTFRDSQKVYPYGRSSLQQESV